MTAIASETPRQRFQTMVGRHRPDVGRLDPAQPELGDVLKGKYRLDELIGEGGMAFVYRAEVLPAGGHVAVKVLAADATAGTMVHGELRRRFEIEALAISELDHPNIVEVHDFGYTDGGLPFLVLELLCGCTLADLIDDGERFAPERVAEIALKIASALEQAHHNQITHRDLKPDNIFITAGPDGADVIKVMDFGIARVRNQTVGDKITARHAVLGTPQYMSPEHLDAAEAGPASDLYSLGVLIYELLTGRTPFDSDDALEVMLSHLHETPPPLVIPGASRATTAVWRRLVGQLLEKDADDRPAGLTELMDTLTMLSRGGLRLPKELRRRRFHTKTTIVLHRMPTALRPTARVARPPARRAWVASLSYAAVLLVILLCTALAGVVGSAMAEPQPPDAPAQLSQGAGWEAPPLARLNGRRLFGR